LTQLIEGDEVYTKVGKNDPAEASEGWTIILMDRASRFIWALDCGKKDRDLFLWAIQRLKEIILRTGDVTLVTDGERRYSLLLFEICQQWFRSGRRGHPRKVLRRGVKVRIKIKDLNPIDGAGNARNINPLFGASRNATKRIKLRNSCESC